jgi:NADH:ubiquinone oxidoreductase subunit K
VIPLYWFLTLSAILFSLGLFAVITRRNTISILMGIELMLNAANINLLAFWRYLYAPQGDMDGLIFAYRKRNTIIANELDTLKG